MTTTTQHVPRNAPYPPPSRSERVRPPLALAATASVLAVVILWVHGGNLATMTRDGGGLAMATGRLTGLIAADLLLIQVLLMARIPWVERAYGQDQLARWHRYTGFTSFNLMLAHVVLITIGYAATDRAGLIGEFWNLITTYPGMLLATAGTAALVLVVLTSIRAARRKLRYESWHLLHLYAYAGVGLALPHEIWTGQDFVLTAPARLYWWTLWTAAAASILAFRIGLPVIRSLRHDLRVAAVVPEAPGITSVYLKGRDIGGLRAQAGQFFTWRFRTGRGWMRAHPYSLSAAPRPDQLRITVKDLGDGSALASRLRPGTRALIEGPYGRMTGQARRRNRLTMIASGIGITPIRALLEAEHYRPGEAVLLYRASQPSDFAFYREIETLSRSRGIAVHYLSGPRARSGWLPSGYPRGPALLAHLVPWIADSDVYVCGPTPWMDEVQVSLDLVGVPPEHVHVERFSW